MTYLYVQQLKFRYCLGKKMDISHLSKECTEIVKVYIWMSINDSDLRETWRISYCREHDNTLVNGLL